MPRDFQGEAPTCANWDRGANVVYGQTDDSLRIDVCRSREGELAVQVEVDLVARSRSSQGLRLVRWVKSRQ